MKTLLILLLFVISPVFLFAQCNPNAGSDDQICGNEYSLQGSIGIVGSDILWTSLTPIVFFGNQNSPATEAIIPAFTGLSQTVTFVLTETNTSSACTASDTVQITFYSVPHPDAGPDRSVCDRYVELCASTTPGANGYWQSILNAWYDYTSWPGDTLPCPPCASDSCVVAYYSSENDTVSYFRTEYNGYCYGYDSVNVYFGSIQAANTLVDPADSINCGLNCDILVAQAPTYGTGYWYDAVPLTQFFPSNYNDNPDSTVISGSSYGMHYFYWVTVNGNCRDTSDVVPIHFYQKPVANAGGNYWPGLFGPNSEIKTDTMCGLYYALTAQLTIGVGMWFSLDPTNTWFESTGFPTSSTYNDTINISYYTVFNAPYYRECVWMVDNHGCVDKDTIRIYYAPSPSGEFIVEPYSCSDSSLFVAHTWPLPNDIDYGILVFNWSLGNLSLSSSTSYPLGDSITVIWPDSMSQVIGFFTVNNWDCQSPVKTMNIMPPSSSKLKGKVFWDVNNDLQYDTTDILIPNQMISLYPLGINTYTDNYGEYNLYSYNGISTVIIDSSSVWNYVNGTSLEINLSSCVIIDTLDFILNPDNPITDMSVQIGGGNLSVTNNYFVSLVCKNEGSLPSAGSVSLDFDPRLTYESSSVSVIQTGNSLTFDTPITFPGEVKYYYFIFTPPGSIYIGDTVYFYSNINSFTTDINLLNNADTISRIVLSSWDPNDKTVYPNGVYQEGYVLQNQPLEYTIRFQNTGNYHASIVIVRDTISTNMDISTLQVLAYSHPVCWQLNQSREIEFTFDNIMLPCESDDSIASNGFITFSICPAHGLPDYSVVENNAAIFFDINPPVLTNTTYNTYVTEIPMSVYIESNKPSLSIFPNPMTTSTILEIPNSQNVISDFDIRISDLTGKVVRSFTKQDFENLQIEKSSNLQIKIERGNLNPGVYIIEINGYRTKLIVE